MNGETAKEFVTNQAGQSAANTDTVCLLHGTDIGSACWIAEHRLNYDRMLQCSPGAFAFCVTSDPRIAIQYAEINPTAGVPAILQFDLTSEVLRNLLGRTPAVVEEDVIDKAYLFKPETFVMVSAAMTNCMVRMVTTGWKVELKMAFGQK